jgi:hypothetical protein
MAFMLPSFEPKYTVPPDMAGEDLSGCGELICHAVVPITRDRTADAAAPVRDESPRKVGQSSARAAAQIIDSKMTDETAEIRNFFIAIPP